MQHTSYILEKLHNCFELLLRWQKMELEGDSSNHSDAPHGGLGASEITSPPKNVPVVLRLHLPDIWAALDVLAH